MLYLFKSVKREYTCKILQVLKLSQNTDNKIMLSLSPWAKLMIVLLRYLASFLLLIPSWTSLTNQQPYIKRKKQTKGKQTKQLASYLTGFNPPCNTHHYVYICKESYIHTNPST